MPSQTLDAVVEIRENLCQNETLTIEGLLDDPDCLAEMEHVFSVFRFRYQWGTLYEITYSNHATAEDVLSCRGVMPRGHIYLDTVETNTLGVGSNGITSEMTHRFLTSH